MTLLELLVLLRKKLALVISLPIVFALATGVYSFAFMNDVYTSQVQLYVMTSQGETLDGMRISSSDTTASQQLANDIAVLAESESVKNATAKSLSLESLEGYETSVTGSTTNRVVTVTVTAENPEYAAIVADELAKQTAKRSVEVMGLQAVNIIDKANIPEDPSGPQRLMYIAVAFLAGLFVAIALVVLMDMLNTSVKSKEEAEAYFGVPVIGTIPEMKKMR